MSKTNSTGTTFEAVPIKGAPFGEYWIRASKANGDSEGIGQLSEDSFKSLDEAEAWINQNLEKPEYL